MRLAWTLGPRHGKPTIAFVLGGCVQLRSAPIAPPRAPPVVAMDALTIGSVKKVRMRLKQQPKFTAIAEFKSTLHAAAHVPVATVAEQSAINLVLQFETHDPSGVGKEASIPVRVFTYLLKHKVGPSRAHSK